MLLHTAEDEQLTRMIQQSWVFTPNQVRAIASEHDYQEISHNKTSRVLSFRDGTTRINVYYTTGTVGTCLNHPTKGKTQLFRRNVVTLQQLDAIFANPREHTGEGYYTRNKASQEWKVATSGNRRHNNKTMTDMARRWEYVATAADLIDGDESALRLLVDAMNRISRMLWDQNTVPTLGDGLNFACGSLTGIVTMVLKVAAGYGVVGTCDLTDVKRYRNEGGSRPEFETLQCYSKCLHLQPFLEVNRDTLDDVEILLRGLPIRLRKEVCNWLIGLKQCGCVLVDEYYQYQWMEVVTLLHEEYSHMYYPKKHLAQVCPIHAVWWPKNRNEHERRVHRPPQS